jgi:hypothetical protein
LLALNAAPEEILKRKWGIKAGTAQQWDSGKGQYVKV